MRADAILVAKVPTTSSSLPNDPTEIAGLAPMDLVRRQVAAALFGEAAALPQVGRFQVAKILGSGGMGVVYAAQDPQLGRTVALKLLRPLTTGDRARERLLREAQAMAQLQHPNVLGVYEAGVHGDQVYVAMEYVEEGTLGDWLRVRARGWQEVVDMLLQAGAGLAAAHAAGIVHRDFKPANILMGGGRARISDFGLARTASAAEELERTAGDSGMLLGAPLTRTGSLLGTPAYMAPEQLRGEPATPASDQFAFGVVTYEALFGHRPFQGDSLGALMQAIDEGKIARPGRQVSLPAPVFAVIRRALAREPARRYPNMPALLGALRAARNIRWRAALGVGVSLTAVLAGGAALALNSQPTEPTIAAKEVGCEGAALAGVWDAAPRAEVEAALNDPRGLAALDDYATLWRDQHALRCTQEPRNAQWTDTCLADRRAALGDLAQAIVDAPPPLSAGAAAAASLLPALSDCAGTENRAVLVSEALPGARVLAWQVRLGIAGAFAPHVAAHPPELHRDALPYSVVQDLRHQPRLALEMDFADAVLGMHPASAPRVPWEGRLLAPFTDDDGPRTYRDPTPQLLRVGKAAADAGQSDLAARSWVLVAELLEAGPHPDSARKAAWEGAERALGKLSSGHPLRRSLGRDLGYLQLAHARHTTQPGTCSGVGSDFAACSPIFSAIRQFKAITGEPNATAVDRELLARMYDHAGEPTAAAALRGANAPVELDERTLGYLAVGAGVVVPDPPQLHESLRCNAEATICQIDRTFAEAIGRDVSVVVGQTRFMASVKDGVTRGTKFYGLRPDDGLKLLGFRNGDLVVEIDSAKFDSAEFIGKFGRLLANGGTLTFERKDVTMTRQFEVR